MGVGAVAGIVNAQGTTAVGTDRYNFSGNTAATALGLFLSQELSNDWSRGFLRLRAGYEVTEILPSIVKYALIGVIFSVAFCVIVHQVQKGALSLDYYKWVRGLNNALAVTGAVFFIYKFYATYSRYVDRLQGESFRVGESPEINYAEKLTTAYMQGHGGGAVPVHPPEDQRGQVQEIIANQAIVRQGERMSPKNALLAGHIASCNSTRNILRVALILIGLAMVIGTSFALRSHFKAIDTEGFPKNIFTTTLLMAAIPIILLIVLLWYATLYLKQKQREIAGDLAEPILAPLFHWSGLALTLT